MTSAADTVDRSEARRSSTVARWRVLTGVGGALAAASAIALLGAGGPKTLLAALFTATAILWITEAIPPAVTALVAVSLAVVLGIASPREAFAAFGTPVLFLFVGSFMIAEAMNLHGLGARFARAMAQRARGRLGVLLATSSAAFLLSMWTSNAASTAVVLPIALHVARGVAEPRFASATVLSIAWAASMGGLCTPVGTPPNLIGIRALEERGVAIDFLGWMKVGVPIGLLMLAALWLLLVVVFRIHQGAAPRFQHENHPWRRGEVAALVSFLLAVVLWLVPGILEAAGVPWASSWRAHLPEEVTVLLCAALLFVWPVNDAHEPSRSALTWSDAARIDWGTVLLFGGGILLGDLGNKTGLAADWSRSLMDVTGVHNTWALVALVTAVAIALSELASNTASATLMVPFALSLAAMANAPPVPLVLGATIGASFGFMMPISTAPNAMAYATGMVTMRQMIVVGILFDVLGFCVVVGGLWWLCPLLGLDVVMLSAAPAP